MFYKPSKFNFYTETNCGDIIVFNTYKGVQSIYKINNKRKEDVINILNSKSVLGDDNELNQTLYQKGFLVPDECDEDQRLKLMYLSNMNDRILKLVILPTEQCNFRCKYCYENFNRGKMSKEIQNSIINFVKANIHKYNGLNVSWFGGEPLLALDVIQFLSESFIDICRKLKKPYTSNITSNGYLLTADTLIKLYNLKILTYTITIDGIRETHNKQKPLANGKDTFDTVISNMLDIKQNVKYKFFNIIIRTNFTKEIYNHIQQYIGFFYDRFNDDKRFSFFARPAGDWGGSTVKGIAESLFTEDSFNEVFKSIINSDKSLNYNYHLKFLQPCGSICVMSSINSFLIDSEGNIRKCSCDLDNEKNIIGKLEDGKMNLDVDAYSKWVDYYDPKEECNNCFFAPACLNNSCLANKVLHRNQNITCQVYEKKYLGYILKLYDNVENIEVLV